MNARMNQDKGKANRTIAVACVAFFAGMVGMAYAAVPLYQVFCQVTGYGGTTQRVEQASDRILDREITVRFDANTAGGLPWEFQPVQREVTIPIGKTVMVKYAARNLFDKTAGARATFNVTPQFAGAYFNKMECFCFTDTELKPGETMDMPVVFFVDPDIVDAPEMKNLTAITLSYTFFPIDDATPVAAGSNKTATDRNLGG